MVIYHYTENTASAIDMKQLMKTNPFYTGNANTLQALIFKELDIIFF